MVLIMMQKGKAVLEEILPSCTYKDMNLLNVIAAR